MSKSDKAIFWDFDGTLAHARHIWSKSMFAALTSCCPGHMIPYEAIRECTHALYPWSKPENDYRDCVGDRWWPFMYSQISAAYCRLGVCGEIADKAARMVRGMVLDVKKHSLYPDTLYILRFCANHGYKNYVLSNNYPELETLVLQLGLLEHFDGIFVSALIGYDKPCAEIFEYALERAGYPRVCCMVGDNPLADIAGAKACGIPAALVHSSGECGADFYAATLSDLTRLFCHDSQLSYGSTHVAPP